jgi:hypothetical protein
MSRTCNTKPWKFRPEPGRWRKWRPSGIRSWSRLYNRQDRHIADADLRKGNEPEPRQPRSRAIWKAW